MRVFASMVVLETTLNLYYCSMFFKTISGFLGSFLKCNPNLRSSPKRNLLINLLCVNYYLVYTLFLPFKRLQINYISSLSWQPMKLSGPEHSTG